MFIQVKFLLHVTLSMIVVALAPSQAQTLPDREPLTFDTPIRAETSHAQASLEEWPTEIWQELVKERLGELIGNPHGDYDWIVDDISLTPLAGSVVKVHDYVERSKAVTERLGGRTALGNEMASFGQGAIHLKVIGIHRETPAGFTARVFVEVDALSAPWVQIRAEWDTRWTTEMKLVELTSRFYEKVALRESRRWLVDRTEDVFGSMPAYVEQLAWGIDDWRDCLERGSGPNITGFYGLALGDANGDGWDDLFVCQPQGLPNRLFLRQGDGTVAEAANAPELNLLDATSSALFVDVDNDGDQDLIVAGDGFLIYHGNEGKGRFVRRQAIPLSGTVTSLAAADYDLDGRIDLYVCGHTALSQKDQESPLGLPIPIHNANNGQANILYRNTSERGFVDVTQEAGIDSNNRRFSYAAAWEDYDQDGDPDLYVANDFGKNNLYRNDRTRFTDVAAECHVEDTGSGMSASWGDVNGDGWMDLYVGNMYSSAGQRIAVDEVQGLAAGNSLFLNQKGKGFAKVSSEQRVHLGRWAWSSVMADLNNDGWQDLLVANGFVTNRRLDDL